jgi:putative ABC transport system permease protein
VPALLSGGRNAPWLETARTAKMWKILLAEFFGDLRTQRLRASLTMGAITWGTIAVVLLLAFGEGLKRTAVRGTQNAGDRMFMVYGNETSKVCQGLPKGRQISLTEDDLELLRRDIPEVDLVSPSYGRGRTTLEYGARKTTTYMEGVYPSFSDMRRMYAAAGGRFLDEQDLAAKRRVVFLGDSLATRLFGTQPPVGQVVTLDNLPFTVVGVMQKKMQTSMNNGPDAFRAIIPASTYRTLYGAKHVGHLLVRPRDVDEAPRVKRRIYEVLGRRYQFDPSDERALSMWDLIEDLKETTRIVLGIQIFLGIVGGFTLLVAGVGVANIMYVVAKERTREIGIKLAVGARKRHIVGQFMFEALLMALLGGTAGLLFSAVVVAGANHLPKGNMAMEFLTRPVLSWPIGLVTIAILTLIGLLAGLFPARKAASVSPVESLRYE